MSAHIGLFESSIIEIKVKWELTKCIISSSPDRSLYMEF